MRRMGSYSSSLFMNTVRFSFPVITFTIFFFFSYTLTAFTSPFSPSTSASPSSSPPTHPAHPSTVHRPPLSTIQRIQANPNSPPDDRTEPTFSPILTNVNRLQAGLLQTNVLLNTGFVPEVIPGLDKAELYIDGEPLRVLVCGELISALFCSGSGVLCSGSV